jgi:hypothetical protein
MSPVRTNTKRELDGFNGQQKCNIALSMEARRMKQAGAFSVITRHDLLSSLITSNHLEHAIFGRLQRFRLFELTTNQ